MSSNPTFVYAGGIDDSDDDPNDPLFPSPVQSDNSDDSKSDDSEISEEYGEDEPAYAVGQLHDANDPEPGNGPVDAQVDLNAQVDQDAQDVDAEIDDPRVWDSDETAVPMEYPLLVEPGFRVEIPDDAICASFFQLVFTDELIDLIVQYTNEFASTKIKISRPMTRNTRLRRWTPVTAEEMRRYISVILIMGLCPINDVKDYWNRSSVCFNSAISYAMSFNRYCMITTMFHLNVSQDDTDNRISKVLPLLQSFRQAMGRVWQPGSALSIDESMCGFRGTVFFRQYIPGKKHKYGLKLYELCEPNGMCIIPWLYTGGQDEFSGTGHVGKVVKKLLSEADALDKGHTVYTDNFYTSISLADYLRAHNTHLVGTLRKNRKLMPEDVTSSKIGKGEVIWRHSESVWVSKWKDKREVFMLSTKHAHEMVETTTKRGKVVEKPKCVVDYNNNMRGVDMGDQFVSYNNCSRKTRRWYMKLFYHMLDLSVSNAWLLYRKWATDTGHGDKTISLKAFRESVLKIYYGTGFRLPASYVPKAARTSVTQPAINDQDQPSTSGDQMHIPDLIPAADGKRNPQKRCRVCYANNVRKDTRYCCSQCKGSPGLCFGKCFLKYHEK